jgi:ribonucleoside-diphosphate reductase beta chain
MKLSSFNNKKIDHMNQPMFFGESVNVARYDKVKYPFFTKIINTQLSQFWRPEEITISKDKSDYEKLTAAEKHIFTSNLKRQTVLDSVQGRGPNLALLPFVSLPELETWIENWGQNETIHSMSYTYILKNIFTEPDKEFDTILDNEEILKCSEQLTHYYDDFIEYANVYNLFGLGKVSITKDDGEIIEYNIKMKELKKKLAMCIASVNVLEGVRFYVSFACSWAFAQTERMEGNAKIIKLICRDENVHLSSTQQIINNFRKKADEGMQEVWAELEDDILDLFDEAVQNEKDWASYLFKDGSMLGLNEKILHQFVEWIANIRLQAIGFDKRYENTENPLPWVTSWISAKGTDNIVQVAPQETEISSYLIGSFSQDAKEDDFKGYKL